MGEVVTANEIIHPKKRSHLTERECLQALIEFASNAERFVTSCEAMLPHERECPEGSIVVKIQAKGDFMSYPNLAEALRVFRGYKLPALAKPTDAE